MATATLRLSTPLAPGEAAAATAPRKGLFKRFMEAMMEARMRQAMRELEMHQHLVPQDIVEETGYKVTQTTDGALPFVR
jgi:hypothetical protein